VYSCMEVEFQLEEKYTSGVWYDRMSGDFCTIQRGFDPDGDGDGRLVELVNPETELVYWDMSLEEWEEEKRDFVQVEEEAVEDPVNFVRQSIDNLVEASNYGGSQLPFTEEISLQYARRKVKIVEE